MYKPLYHDLLEVDTNIYDRQSEIFNTDNLSG